MTRARSLARLANENALSVSTDLNVGVNSTSPVEKLNVVGVVSATSFFGDGTSLSGVGNTDYIITGTAATFTGGINAAQSDVSVRNLTGVAATFTGVVTYEDVTNVDSVGFATFRKGINAQGAGSTTTTLNVTGVSTFGGNVSIADSIIHTGDTDTSIRFPAADTFTVETAGGERLRIDSSGRLGIGTNTPGNFNASGDNFVVSGTGNIGVTLASLDSNSNTIYFADSTTGTGEYIGFVEYIHSSDSMRFATSATEALRIDSSQRLLLGTTSSRSTAGTGADLQVETTDAGGRISVVQNRNDATPCPFVVIGKSRGTSIGSNTVLQNNDRIGAIVFAGADGTDMGSDAARIIAEVDGTPGSNDMPGRLILSTTSDGSDSATERLRITSTGGFHFNNAELIERTNIVANKLSAVPNVSLDNGMVHYYTTNETTTANPNIITTTGINTDMSTGDTMSVTILSKPNNAGYFPRISIDGLLTGITTYWNGGSAPSSANSSGVDVNTYQIIKTGDAAFDVLANTSNFAS